MQLKLANGLIALATVGFSSVGGGLAQVITTAYSSAVSCSGDSLQCYYTFPGDCCWMPVGFGYSVQVTNLPRGATAKGYRSQNDCLNDNYRVYTLFGDGVRCWNSGGYDRASWMKWNLQVPTRRSVGETEATEAQSKKEGQCDFVEPNVFRYLNTDGKMRAIKIPAEKGSAQKVVDLRNANNYTALAEYEVFLD